MTYRVYMDNGWHIVEQEPHQYTKGRRKGKFLVKYRGHNKVVDANCVQKVNMKQIGVKI